MSKKPSKGDVYTKPSSAFPFTGLGGNRHIAQDKDGVSKKGYGSTPEQAMKDWARKNIKK